MIDWLSDHFDHYVPPDEDELEYSKVGCVFGAQCLMSSPHFEYECYTKEMAEEWANEHLKNESKSLNES